MNFHFEIDRFLWFDAAVFGQQTEREREKVATKVHATIRISNKVAPYL